MDSGHTGRRAFREVVSRNNGRARRRWLWGLAESETVGGGPIRTDSGGMMNEPYNDEIAPHVSRADLATHPPFPVLGANWNNSGDGKEGEFKGNSPTPKQTGGTPDATYPQRQEPSEQNIQAWEKKEFAGKRQVGHSESDFSVNVTEVDIAHAGGYPTSGWPEYEVMFPMGRPNDFLTAPIFHPGILRRFPPDHGWCPAKNLDPLSQALRAA